MTDSKKPAPNWVGYCDKIIAFCEKGSRKPASDATTMKITKSYLEILLSGKTLTETQSKTLLTNIEYHCGKKIEYEENIFLSKRQKERAREIHPEMNTSKRKPEFVTVEKYSELEAEFYATKRVLFALLSHPLMAEISKGVLQGCELGAQRGPKGCELGASGVLQGCEPENPRPFKPSLPLMSENQRGPFDDDVDVEMKRDDVDGSSSPTRSITSSLATDIIPSVLHPDMSEAPTIELIDGAPAKGAQRVRKAPDRNGEITLFRSGDQKYPNGNFTIDGQRYNMNFGGFDFTLEKIKDVSSPRWVSDTNRKYGSHFSGIENNSDHKLFTTSALYDAEDPKGFKAPLPNSIVFCGWEGNLLMSITVLVDDQTINFYQIPKGTNQDIFWKGKLEKETNK